MCTDIASRGLDTIRVSGSKWYNPAASEICVLVIYQFCNKDEFLCQVKWLTLCGVSISVNSLTFMLSDINFSSYVDFLICESKKDDTAVYCKDLTSYLL